MIKNKNQEESKHILLAAQRLKELRESSGLNQKQFAEIFDVNPTTYNRYESGDIRKMSSSLIQSISEKFGINPAWLIGFENVEKYMVLDKATENPKRIPILGTIAAGIPILAQEYIEGYEYVPENLHIDFCLRVKGDSMINARILDGDIVYIRQQPCVENGEIAAVIIDNEEATLKRFYQINGNVILRPENPNYKDYVFSKKDMKNVQILGKAVYIKTEVR